MAKAAEKPKPAKSSRKSGAKPTKAKAPKEATRQRRSWKAFLLRFVLVVAAILVLVPAALLFLYRSEAINPVSTLMLRDWIIGPGVKREWVALQDMSPLIYQSVLMSEDGKFCAHNGIDWAALNQVVEDSLSGERTRGASTITMQLVKNLFLWPNRSFIRKGLEIPYALMADAILSKRRIMEIYLNIVELDKGVFGVGAAAKHYFNRSAEKLGPRYSARLAVTLPNPKARNPAKPTPKLRSLAAIIQKRARASGAYIKCLSQS